MQLLQTGPEAGYGSVKQGRVQTGKVTLFCHAVLEHRKAGCRLAFQNGTPSRLMDAKVLPVFSGLSSDLLLVLTLLTAEFCQSMAKTYHAVTNTV